MNILSTDRNELYQCVKWAQHRSRPRWLWANKPGLAVCNHFLLPSHYRKRIEMIRSLRVLLDTLIELNQSVTKETILP